MLGSAYGQAANDLLPHQTAPAGAYALVGMAAVFAAAARAPITSVLIVFELTGDYRIILPLMCATVVATTLEQRALARDDLLAQAPTARDRSARQETSHAPAATTRARRPATAPRRCHR